MPKTPLPHPMVQAQPAAAAQERTGRLIGTKIKDLDLAKLDRDAFGDEDEAPR